MSSIVLYTDMVGCSISRSSMECMCVTSLPCCPESLNLETGVMTHEASEQTESASELMRLEEDSVYKQKKSV